MINLAQEIYVVENVIRLLNECLKINIETSNKIGVKSCLKDIRICKIELQRLTELQLSIGMIKAAPEANKGALKNVLQ